ncbi:MAG: MerR family transcriptional regulator [Candidatus Scalindua sp.]|nr:MerR family transcriptional regulator [Candidatus Scalindua sp.]
MSHQPEERLFSVSEALRILDIPRHKLTYLFESRKIKAEDFITLDNGQRLYRNSDIQKIKQALYAVSAK